jgi:hypothetical protein
MLYPLAYYPVINDIETIIAKNDCFGLHFHDFVGHDADLKNIRVLVGELVHAKPARRRADAADVVFHKIAAAPS